MDTLFIIYRAVTPPVETIYIISSKDGVNWSCKREVLTVNINKERALSPVITQSGINNSLWTVDIVPSPNIIRKREMKTKETPFKNSLICNLTLPPSAEGQEVWHIDVTKAGECYYMLINTTEHNQYGTKGRLYLAKSTDSANWTVAQQPLIVRNSNSWDTNLYRGCIIPSSYDKEFLIWYSGHNLPTSGWAIGHTKVEYQELIPTRLQ